MELVADTNVVAAAILRKGQTRSLVFSPDLQLYSPERLPEELEKHENEFMEKSGLDASSYGEAVKLVLANISMVQAAKYLSFEKEARKISPDADDWPFFALALSRGCGLWSSEKRLKKQQRVMVYNTEELLGMLVRKV